MIDTIDQQLSNEFEALLDSIENSEIASKIEEIYKNHKIPKKKEEENEYFDWTQLSYLEITMLSDAKFGYNSIEAIAPEFVNVIRQLKDRTNDYYSVLNMVVPRFVEAGETDQQQMQALLGAIHWIFYGYKLQGLEAVIDKEAEKVFGESNELNLN